MPPGLHHSAALWLLHSLDRLKRGNRKKDTPHSSSQRPLSPILCPGKRVSLEFLLPAAAALFGIGVTLRWKLDVEEDKNPGNLLRKRLPMSFGSPCQPTCYFQSPQAVDFVFCPYLLGFPYGSVGKESACNAGNPGSIPGSGRSPGEGNGNPLQYSCLENPMGHIWILYMYLLQSK